MGLLWYFFVVCFDFYILIFREREKNMMFGGCRGVEDLGRVLYEGKDYD